MKVFSRLAVAAFLFALAGCKADQTTLLSPSTKVPDPEIRPFELCCEPTATPEPTPSRTGPPPTIVICQDVEPTNLGAQDLNVRSILEINGGRLLEMHAFYAPYHFSEWSHGKYMRFERNESFYELYNRPIFGEIIVQFLQNGNASLAKLLTKECNMFIFYNISSLNDYDTEDFLELVYELEAAGQIKIVFGPGMNPGEIAAPELILIPPDTCNFTYSPIDPNILWNIENIAYGVYCDWLD